MRKYKVTGLPQRSNIGAVPKYAPGGAYGPGDGIKKFLRKAKDNTWLTANYGKLNTNATNYVPTIGLNTIMGSPKKGFHDFNTNIGGDKGGLAANLKYQYYGPFMSGQRNFQGSAGAEAYYDQDKYGAQFFAGPNIPLGSSAKHRDDELRRGSFRFDIMPNLNVSMWDQIGDTETKYYQPAPNEPIISTEVPKGAKLDWGYGLDLKGEYKFKKIPLSLFGRASYQADLVRDSTSSGVQYTPADMVWVDSDNPDQISGQFGPDGLNGQTYTLGPDYVGGNEVINSSKDEGWKTDNKFNFTLGARYNLDNLRFNPKNKSKRKIKELEENDPYYNPGVRTSQGSIEGVNEELDEQKYGGPHDPPKVKQRRGVRENPDGTVSSHLMRAEYIPERGWVGFPALFQDSKPYADDQQNWVDMYEEEDWMKVYEEAERRGEVYDFGEDKEAALAFRKGSWKDESVQSPEAWEQEIRKVEKEIGNPRGWTMDDYHMMQDKLNEYKAWREKHPEVIDHSNEPNEYIVPLPPHLNADQYIEADLTPEEVEQYKAGGYILEELEEGGEDDIVRPHGDPYEYKKVGDKYYTRKTEGEWNQEYAEGDGPKWNLASGEPEDAIKYNVFKEERPKPAFKKTITPLLYDPNDPSNFESRYNNEFKLDQSQDGLKPEYFNNQLPLLNLDGRDPDAEYNAWVAAKPQYTRAPSWLDKNVFEPVGDLYKKFQNTSLGPIDDATNFVNDMFVKPAVDLAVDTYNDPNKVAGEVMQMMVDGVQAPSKILAESIYTDFINPEAEFDWNNIGSEKSLQRAGEIATLLPMIPKVFGTATKTANVANKVDDVVNVTNKTKKTISRPTAAVTTQERALTKIQQLKKDGVISPTLNEQVLIDNPNLLDAAVRDGIKKKLTVNRNVYTGDDFASQVFPDQAQEAFYTGTHTDILGDVATGQRVGLGRNMSANDDALYTFRGKGNINSDYGTHNVEARIPFDYSGSTDEMVANFNNLQKGRVQANPTQVADIPANQIKPGAVIDDVSGEGITAVVGEKGSKVLDPINVTTDVELTKLHTNYQTLNKEAQTFMETKDVSGINKKYNTNFKNAEEAQHFLNRRTYNASKDMIEYTKNPPANPVLKTTNYSPFNEFSNTPSASTTTAMAETTSGNVVPVNNLQKVKNSPYMKGSDGKTYLRESEYNNFTGTRKANLDKKIANGEVEVLRQTPDGNAYLLSDKSIANIDKTIKTKLDRMKTDKGRQLTFEQEKAYIKKEFPELDDAAANQAANQAVDARIAEVESLYKNKNYQQAYYDLEEMNAHMEIGDDVITSTQYQPEQVANFDKTINPVNQNANMRFHPGLADDAAVVSHEGAHITAPGRNLPIEDEILNAVGSPKNLSAQDQVAYDYLVATSKKRKKLINDMRNHDPANANLSEAELIDKYSNLGQSKGDIFTADYTFGNDIKKVQQLSSEVLPYAQELKQVLLDRGLIDDWFQEITPDILAKAKQTISQEPAGFYTADMLGNVENATSTTRLLDITDPSRYEQLSNSLNKIAPVAVPAAAVGTGTMMNEQDGGFIERELTKEDALKYAQNGYIVEEMHEGGSPHSHPHEDEVTVAGSRKDPPLTYTQKLAAYDDSLAAYNWAKDNSYADYDKKLEQALRYYDPKSKTNYGKWADTNNDGYADEWVDNLTFDEYADEWRDKIDMKVEDFNVKPFTYSTQGLGKRISPDLPMYVKPTYPTKPTMKEAYKNVDKEKYPTFEDFEYAAEFYKKHGENPDPSDLPSSRLPAPPPPEYEVEDIEPEIEIEKLDVIQPEFLSNDAELPELEEREEVEGVDYKIKRGPYFTQGSGFLDLQKGLVGTAGRTGRRLKYKGPKLKWGERRVPIEDEQLYPEGFAPKFYNQGGFMEVDLTNEQVDKYRAEGYTVEKIK